MCRLAIIPLTASSCSSYAQLVNKGAKVLPKKMVTHNWSNLFRDLLGATPSASKWSARATNMRPVCLLGRKWIQKKNSTPRGKKNKRPKGPPKIECMGLKNPVGSPRAQKEKTKKLKSNWTRRSLVPNLPLFLWLLMLSCLPVSWATCAGNPRNGSLVCNTQVTWT